jgi:hypothetical protein
MNTIQRSRLVPKRKIRGFGGRGDIYAWLRRHHSSIEPLLTTQPRLWAGLVADMTEDGITDGRGAPPSPNNVLNTWARVVRDLVAEAPLIAAAEAKRAKRRRMPSRLSPDWVPTVVVAPGQSPPPGWPADRVVVGAPARPPAAAPPVRVPAVVPAAASGPPASGAAQPPPPRERAYNLIPMEERVPVRARPPRFKKSPHRLLEPGEMRTPEETAAILKEADDRLDREAKERIPPWMKE